MRSNAGSPLTIAEDMVDWNVASATRNITISPVIDDECRVGKTSVQRLNLHLASPTWKRGDSCFEIERRHRCQCRVGTGDCSPVPARAKRPLIHRLTGSNGSTTARSIILIADVGRHVR